MDRLTTAARRRRHTSRGLVSVLTLFAVLGMTPTAAAIGRGSLDASSPENDAVVKVHGKGECTGTLVAPDLVLTAAHCFDHPQQGGANFNQWVDGAGSHGNWETPGQWYPFPTGKFSIDVGRDTQQALVADTAVPTAWNEFIIGVVQSAFGEREAKNDDVISLLAVATRGYVAAEKGGGSIVTANRDVAQSWEQFTLVTEVDGQPFDGDLVALRASDGSSYLTVDPATGSLSTTAPSSGLPDPEMLFEVLDPSAGYAPAQFVDRTSVVIRAANGSFVRAVEFASEITEYSMAGYADVMLVRLSRPVPSRFATPISPLTWPLPDGAKYGLDRSQPTADQAAFWRNQSFTMAGYGADATGNLPRYRQSAGASNGHFCDVWGWSWSAKLCADGDGGSSFEGGDSGGPLLWQHPNDPTFGSPFVIGVGQGAGDGQGGVGPGGRYFLTSADGGRDSLGYAKPAIGVWLDEMLGRDRCISFDPAEVSVRMDPAAQRRYQLLVDGFVIEDFFTDRLTAEAARDALKDLGLAKRCIARNFAEHYYIRADGRLPWLSATPAQTCFDASTMRIEGSVSKGEFVGDEWKLIATPMPYAYQSQLDIPLFRFGNEPEAGYNAASFMRSALQRLDARCFANYGPMRIFGL